jgi:hypothetical protein
MNKRVKIENKEIGQTAEVLPQTLHVWEKRGWTVVDDGSDEKSAETPVVRQQAPQTQTTFNPVGQKDKE